MQRVAVGFIDQGGFVHVGATAPTKATIGGRSTDDPVGNAAAKFAHPWSAASILRPNADRAIVCVPEDRTLDAYAYSSGALEGLRAARIASEHDVDVTVGAASGGDVPGVETRFEFSRKL